MVNPKIQEIIENIQEKFSLDNYHLKRHHIYQEINGMNETSYILNMEWFPNDVEQVDEDYNPAGTASIDVDIHTKSIKSIIFVQSVTYADQTGFPSSNKENAIEWVEELTGLEFGRQFRLIHDENNGLSFQAAVDNIPVYPSGSIQVKFNEDDKLVLFSIDGYFPNEEQLNWEPFALLPDTTDPIAKAQCKLLEIPVEDEERWISVYGATTIFVSNDGKRTISFEDVESHPSTIKINKVMEWEEPIEEPFIPEEIDMSVEVSVEQALANEPHPETIPIKADEKVEIMKETKRFLQQKFPEDSGKWTLREIRRENNYIFAELKPANGDNRVINRKILLILDSENYNALNYIDNSLLLDMFKDFQTADATTISPADAFEVLREHIEVTPVYVYDKEKERYILCGKIDCGYGVDAASGETVLLDEL